MALEYLRFNKNRDERNGMRGSSITSGGHGHVARVPLHIAAMDTYSGIPGILIVLFNNWHMRHIF